MRESGGFKCEGTRAKKRERESRRIGLIKQFRDENS